MSLFMCVSRAARIHSIRHPERQRRIWGHAITSITCNRLRMRPDPSHAQDDIDLNFAKGALSRPRSLWLL